MTGSMQTGMPMAANQTRAALAAALVTLAGRVSPPSSRVDTAFSQIRGLPQSAWFTFKGPQDPQSTLNQAVQAAQILALL